MVTLSISPKMLRQKDLVVIPRQEYEQLLHVVKGSPRTLDESLAISMAEARAGKLRGPFKSAGALMKSLRTKR